MTGKEAQELMEKLYEIQKIFARDNASDGYFLIGRLYEELAQIEAINKCSFNPTVNDENKKKDFENGAFLLASRPPNKDDLDVDYIFWIDTQPIRWAVYENKGNNWVRR
jgi:hypothetical protein